MPECAVAATKGSIALIKEFFGTPERPVGTDELKRLSGAERLELADAIAEQRGLKKTVVAGVPQYG